MGQVKIRYYVTRQRPGARRWGYWAPCLARRNETTGRIGPTLMALLGFRLVDCGEDGPLAWAIAADCNRRWDAALAAHRANKNLSPDPQQDLRLYPGGSLGEAFARFRRTETWQKKKPRTREDWLRGFRHIEPLFADVDPASVALEHLDAWYAALLRGIGVREAHRAMKIWRALWRVIASMNKSDGGRYCVRDADPSLGIRRETPKPRAAVWFEGEAVRLVKAAIRLRYHGLAAALAVAWDTQLSPADIVSLTQAKLKSDADGPLFIVERAKSGRPAIGTLSKRSAYLFARYVASLPFALHPEAPFFHTRGGEPSAKGGRRRPPVPYTVNKLGQDFRALRAAAFPGDDRQLADFRRSGAIEAKAGRVELAALADKMGNTIDRSRFLQSTYLPPDATVVRLADAARARGRARLRGSRGESK